MQKIMFNDRYGLTQAVIEGRKTMTRRLVKPEPEDCSGFHKSVPVMFDWRDEPMSLIFDAHNNAVYCQYCGYGIDAFAKFKFKPKYKMGEVVAVAQSYEQIYLQGEMSGDDAIILGLKHDPAMSNKMYARVDLMPHRIRITNIRCERLQEISDEDCMREGIFSDALGLNFGLPNAKKTALETVLGKSWRGAFASLIDKVSGCGTWERNPWVVVYEFELVK